MNIHQWRAFEDVAKWLFERSGEEWAAQWGLAGANKRATRWCPGNLHMVEPPSVAEIRRATYAGCTPLAFKDSLRPQGLQHALVCWVGLDLDADPTAPIDLAALVAALPPSAALRRSAGGFGVHVILRLAEPEGPMPLEMANKRVRQITAPLVEALRVAQIPVCSSDRRLFWLVGGQQAWIRQPSTFYDPAVSAPVPLDATVEPVVTPAGVPSLLAAVPGGGDIRGAVTEQVAAWLALLVEEKVLREPVAAHNLVYVGDVVRVLRDRCGEKIETASPCSGNGEANGYVDVDRFGVSLWTYADKRAVWRFEDVEAMCK